MSSPLTALTRMTSVLDALAGLGRFGLFFLRCFRSIGTHGVPWRRVVDEAYRNGVRSFPVLATMALFVGSNLALQGHSAFSILGAQNLVGMFVGLAGVREICPLLAATMIAAKAGTEIAAQLAVMRTREQIDALEVMGVDSRAELVAPSLVAVMIVLPALTVLGLFLSVASAWAVAVLQLGVNSGAFFDFLLRSVHAHDLYAATGKSLVFGAVIATVSSYFGYFSEPGPKGVGQATNRAVVAMCIVCISVNFLLTSLFYG